MRRVLLLNITYEPLTTVGLHRAVCLVLADKAEILHNESSGLVLHSASARLDAPSVIRLRRYVRVVGRRWRRCGARMGLCCGFRRWIRLRMLRR